MVRADRTGIVDGEQVSCTTKDPSGDGGPMLASLQTMDKPVPAGKADRSPGRTCSRIRKRARARPYSDVPPMGVVMPASYQKFTSQMDLGHYLMAQYHIRTANELSSCETCHR